MKRNTPDELKRFDPDEETTVPGGEDAPVEVPETPVEEGAPAEA